ncbi:MAG TPA: FtsQ-type POTRA domain-containing protein [Solirubrobacteraceae bacterium]|nr:FtsQ-type POTRA domain-containing protein [Solirubrobacteraceae bacterium]
MRTPAAALRRPSASIARVRAALTPSRRTRRRVVVAVVLAALLAGLYMLWLRDSSFVAVEDVTVTGLTSRDSDRVRLALAATAETMTTLHVDERRLQDAAAAFPVVARIEARPDFPHAMTIEVTEHRPVALAVADGREQPLAGDGSLLAGTAVEGDLPTIDLYVAMPQRRLGPGAARDAAQVAGAAPAVVARRVESISREAGARGVVAQLEDGTELLFGTPSQLAAKWAAAIRVLADDEADGAAYLDVRIPERPVAGGLAAAPVAPVGSTPTDPQL